MLTIEADGAKAVGSQNPPRTSNIPLAEFSPAVDCPIVPSSANIPPVVCCPPEAVTDCVTAKTPLLCRKAFKLKSSKKRLKIKYLFFIIFLPVYGQTTSVKTIAPALSIENNLQVAPSGDFKMIP